ncbi:hypothetical protein PV325_003963 [Microctonus aethiopoides]|nr:hypothetical protein PV325_003963 [Microctonus aethiopoides]
MKAETKLGPGRPRKNIEEKGKNLGIRDTQLYSDDEEGKGEGSETEETEEDRNMEREERRKGKWHRSVEEREEEGGTGVYANGREDRNDEEKKEVSRLKHMNWGRSYEKRDKHPKVVWNFNERNGQLEEVTFRGEAERNRRRQEATATTAGRWKYD